MEEYSPFLLLFCFGFLGQFAAQGVDGIACKWEVLLASFQLFFHLSHSSTLHRQGPISMNFLTTNSSASA